MGRLNISIPDDLQKLADKWRRNVNLSEICSRALRQELEALEFHRKAAELFSALRPHSELERKLITRYRLSDAVVTQSPDDAVAVRDVLGEAAANYLNRYLCDGSLLAIGGGRQMWCLVRNLTPRQVAVAITGVGIGQTDPRVLHAHPNTLTTLLWLLFSPRGEARIIGRNGDDLKTIWNASLPASDHPKYFVVGSCGPFDRNCPLASLLGDKITEQLLHSRVCGDFMYQFFTEHEDIISIPHMDYQFILSAEMLRHLSQRADARVILVAGGEEKVKIIKVAAKAGLCNVLITDSETALRLVGGHA